MNARRPPPRSDSTGVKDTLAITFRQLAALPLDLSHRRLVPAFVAGSHAADSAAEQVEIQQTLDRLASDFGIPLAAFIDRTGTLVAINASARSARASIQGNFANREYFVEAMASGTAVQFLLGRASGVPGLYFSSRVLNDGQPVGVALVKQDTERLNRLLADTDGARVFVTDVNGVVVLSNHNDLMLKRVPGGQNRDDALWQEVYQRVPAPLDWTQGRLADGAARRALHADRRHAPPDAVVRARRPGAAEGLGARAAGRGGSADAQRLDRRRAAVGRSAAC